MKRVACALACGVAFGACTPSWKRTPHDQLFQREAVTALIAEPAGRSISDWWDRGRQSFVRPLGRALSPGRWVARGIGGRTAQDINELDQVPDSEWFENRIGRRAYTVEEAFRGATRDRGPETGDLRVVSGKLNGASPGFVVRDLQGITWYIKLDPPASPELSTSAETISSRLLFLAGYHVAEIHALDLDPRRFVVDPQATMRDKYNRKIPMTAKALKNLIRPMNTDLSGNVRVLASRQPEGVVLGPFSYADRVLGDPNDLIPHEHRRSLRGLWVFSAWINNTDIRDQNSLNVFRPVGEAGRGVIRHYQLDFGNSFGATGTKEKSANEGLDYVVDWQQMLANLVTFGFRYPPRLQRSPFRSVGLFESRQFNPADWHPTFRNPAFDEATQADAFWAAAILARIQPDHIRAAVTAGRYRDEGAASYVIETLLERRRKLLAFAFSGFLEVDRPRIENTVLVLDDLRALGGLSPLGTLDYTIRWNRTRGSDQLLAHGKVDPPPPPPPLAGQAEVAPATIAGRTELHLELAEILGRAARSPGFAEDPFLTVE
ncbi:MAG: hypothetical protein WKG01_35605, partial [Kofleriaceae bacterium]